MMIHYIIQVLIFQTLFLAIYDLFLKKETFFQWNRAYLIVSSILAYIIPFIKIESATTYVQENFITLPEVILNPEIIFLNEVNLVNENTPIFTLQNLYILGITIAFLLFIYKISLIFIKIYQNTILIKKDYNLVILPKQQTAFSFFRYLFLGKSLFEKEHQHIIKHELTHIKQKHSIDLIYFELQKIVFWFNPFSYLFQNRISALHEYIADEKTIKEENKKSFFESLLNQTFQIEKFSFVNQFYKKSLIKKRIIMATKNKSKEILKLKYLLIIPLLISMLLYTSCDESEEIKLDESSKVYDLKELDKSPYLEGSTKKDNNERKMELILRIAEEFFKKSKQIKYNDNFKNHLLSFVINENGKIENIDYSSISKENLSIAKDLILSLPNFKPGIKNGKPVKTQMEIPFMGYPTKEEEKETIPFSVIENVPIYPGCNGNNEELKKCMSKKITQHVSKSFNVALANDLELEAGKKRISVQFKIDKQGNVADIKARAPHPKLQEEAIRIIKLLPKMEPGKQDDKAVNVRYNLPIIFNVQDDAIIPPTPPAPITPPSPIKNNNMVDDVPFSVIDEAPVYPGCSGNNEELKKCISKNITKHVSRNFNTALAKELDLSVGKKRISIQFKIDNNGYISDVKARAPHPILQEEAIRVIKLLPKMKAGRQDGKAVNVRYNLPIIFNVE